MLYHVFRFFYYFVAAVDLILIVLLAFVSSFLPMAISKYFMHALFQKMCRAFVRFFGIELHIHHNYTGELPKHYILIANHPSGADIVIANALFKVYPLAKEEIKQWWFLGRISKAAGIAFVKREDRESRHAAKENLLTYVSMGKNLLIYPEGGCFGKHLRPFKYGAFDIAMASKLPILPIYFCYEAENSFEWGDYGLIRHIIYLLTAPNKHAHCYIFPPVESKDFTDAQAFAEHLHCQYESWEKKYRLEYL